MDIVFIFIAYLIGSVSSAIIACKAFKLPDPREQGSGNAGATNVLRFADKRTALLVLVSDIAKGLVAVWFAWLFGVSGTSLGFVALAAVLGHIYPIYFNFKGGKGVATGFGTLLGLSFVVGVVACVAWLITAAIYRYSSLSALVAAVVAPLFALVWTPAYFVPLFIMSCILFWKHKDNIQRLMDKTEPKINQEQENKS